MCFSKFNLESSTKEVTLCLDWILPRQPEVPHLQTSFPQRVVRCPAEMAYNCGGIKFVVPHVPCSLQRQNFKGADGHTTCTTVTPGAGAPQVLCPEANKNAKHSQHIINFVCPKAPQNMCDATMTPAVSLVAPSAHFEPHAVRCCDFGRCAEAAHRSDLEK